MGRIIVPGVNDDRDNFAYAMLVGAEGKFGIAVLKLPLSMVQAYGENTDEEQTVLWLGERTDDRADNGFEVSRYELYSARLQVESLESPDSLDNVTRQKDGYVYLPKDLRDGRHEERYLLVGIQESDFTFKVENGMYEEVCWSPHGFVQGAIDQEASNLGHNHLLREWKEYRP